MEFVSNGDEFQSGKMKTFERWLEGVGIQQCECIETHYSIHFKMIPMVNFMIYVFCHNLKINIF